MSSVYLQEFVTVGWFICLYKLVFASKHVNKINLEVGRCDICPLQHYITALWPLLTDGTSAAEAVPSILEFVQVGHILDGV